MRDHAYRRHQLARIKRRVVDYYGGVHRGPPHRSLACAHIDAVLSLDVRESAALATRCHAPKERSRFVQLTPRSAAKAPIN